ncbi:hypothetical protein [Rhodococcus jostii]|uniref:Alcohol dehydrogenase n=1 Tax=Rhodococcus jostii TaxID=132919 RepID=A0A1H4S802_RHOJO|nr:hypothetical protein [Rhodococcus jostii]SEC40197.1 hypothetical protein SAMN04490220_1542 [Rhodococcus jostii]
MGRRGAGHCGYGVGHDWLGNRDFYGLAFVTKVPVNTLADVSGTLSGGCLATEFVWAQHHGALLRLVMYEALAPGGTAVVVGQVAEGRKITIDPFVMSDREKTLTGSNYGSCRPPANFPKIVDLYMNDRLPLDSLIERTIGIDEINKAFDAMIRGEAARSIIIHEH